MIFGLNFGTVHPIPGFDRCAHSTEVSSHEGLESVVTASLDGLERPRVAMAWFESLEDPEECVVLAGWSRLAEGLGASTSTGSSTVRAGRNGAGV